MSEFSSITKNYPELERGLGFQYPIDSFKAFALNRDEHEISVMTVVSRREPVFWELLPLEGTQNWRNYVNISSSRGLPLVLFVQAFEKISLRTEAGGDHEGQGDIVSEETETMHESPGQLSVGKWRLI